MPFLTQSDIAARLPASYDSGLVDDLLIQVESELLNLGLSFNGFVTSTRKIQADKYGQSVFDVLPFEALTSVKIKQYGSDSETVLVADTDYRIVEVQNVEGIYSRIELIRNWCNYEIRDPEYLEVTGSWGFMSTVPADLKAVIIRYILSQLEYSSLGYRSILESKTGDSMTKYSDNSQEYVNSITSYKPFISALNKYVLW